MKQKKEEATQLLVVQEGVFWASIEHNVYNAVVQICAQMSPFNWLEPYKNNDPFEMRGSGFIIDQAGHIITNMHVINEANHIWIHVPLLGRQAIEVQVISVCPDIDIALLQIVSSDLKKIKKLLKNIPFITFGDSDTLQRAESVMALGYPLGQSCLKSTTGVISGHEYVLDQSLIQMTAPINSGSSGGPLLNNKGQVVGVTVATLTDAQNVGYAVPSNTILVILEDLFSTKLVSKPTLGARFVYSNDKKAQLLGNPSPAGLYVCAVYTPSLLSKAGVQKGDMLYEFGGYALDEYGDASVSWAINKVSIEDLVERIRVNDRLSVGIYRNGQYIKNTITVTMENPFAIKMKYPYYEKVSYETFGGLIIMELTQNHIDELLDDIPTLGYYTRSENRLNPALIITHILPGSYMYQLRILETGFIINAVNTLPVTTLLEFNKALQSSTKNIISLTVDSTILIALDIKELLKDEDRLHKDFTYPLGTVVRALKGARKKKMNFY